MKTSLHSRPGRLPALLTTILCLTAAVTHSSGNPIAYTFEGTANGTVGAAAFTNARFTIELFANTTDVKQVADASDAIFAVAASSTTISLSGIGAGMFTEVTLLFVNQESNVVGLTHSSPLADLLDMHNFAFASYDLTSAFGSAFDPTPDAVWQFQNISSTMGRVSFASARDVTFSAIEVPEPSCALLIGAWALAALIFGGSTQPRDVGGTGRTE